jgi:3-hydroxyacyl-CoA dehydrogenase
MLRRSIVAAAAAPIQRVIIFGSGVVGGGIAQACAAGGYAVTLVEADAKRLARNKVGIENWLHASMSGRTLEFEWPREQEQARIACTQRSAHEIDADVAKIMSNITTETNAVAAVACADLVIDAAPDSVPERMERWQAVDAAAPASAIFVTTTPSFPASVNASAAFAPLHGRRFAGMFFVWPVLTSRDVVLVGGDGCEQAVLDALVAFCARMGKEPQVEASFAPRRRRFAWRALSPQALEHRAGARQEGRTPSLDKLFDPESKHTETKQQSTGCGGVTGSDSNSR